MTTESAEQQITNMEKKEAKSKLLGSWIMKSVAAKSVMYDMNFFNMIEI